MSKYSASVIPVDDDYFNINDIMATKANIACTFLKDTPPDFFRIIGQPAPESISDKGYKTETPSWIMCTLNEGAINYQPQLPKAFTDVTRNSLLAAPEGKNLESLSMHFYLFGIRLAQLIKRKTGQDIASALLTLLRKRAGWILKLAVNPSHKATSLDSTEKAIFLKAQASEARTIDWFHRNNENQKMSRKRNHSRIS